MNPIVKTQYGEVRGSVANGVNTFKGISYAAPPFGVNRLRPPHPLDSIRLPLSLTSFRQSCPG